VSTPKDFSHHTELPADDFAALTHEPPALPDFSFQATIDPNNPPWGILPAVGVWIISLVLLVITPLLFVVPYILRKGIRLEAVSEFLQTDKTGIFLQILSVIPAHLLTLAVAWAMVTQFGKRPLFWRSLGWSWSENFRARRSIIAALVLFAAGALITTLFKGEETQLDKILTSSRATAYLIAFLAVATAPIVEEVVYRGLLYSSLQRAFGVKWGVVSVLALFTAVHVPQYWPNYGVIAAVGLLSAALTIIRARSGRLLPCFVIHLIFNGITSVLIVLQPYIERFSPGSRSTGEQKAAALWSLTRTLRAFL